MDILGDRLYLFSGGVTEAMNEAEEVSGADRLVAAMRNAGERPPTETPWHLRRSADRRCGGDFPGDDFTLLAPEVRAP